MKNILGRNIVKKRAISTNGKELGRVRNAYFEDNGKIDSLIINPHRALRGVEDYLNSEGLLIVSYDNVRAVGEYVVLNFPPE